MKKVYLVGAGCGKDLLTLRGAQLLKEADCVVYDSLLDGSVLELCRADCERICAGKRSGGRGMKQEEINRILVECGRKYERTVRLKGGDPYVFGRGGEEMLALMSAGIACECVPGVKAVRVAVTGTPMHTERVCGILKERGIAAENCAFARVVPFDFDAVWDTLEKYRCLVFTSANGVRLFFERALRRGVDFRTFGDKKFAAIGAFTAKTLASYGFIADYVPKAYTSGSLRETLQKTGLSRDEILLLRSASGDEGLEEVGIQADLYDVAVDENLLAKAADVIAKSQIVTFGSANGARAVLDRCALPQGCAAVCIGEKTAKAVREYGYLPEVCAEASAQALADAVERITEKLKCKG